MSNNPINLALRFLLELAAIASLVISVPVLFASIWGIFAVKGDPSRSGKTVIQTPGWARLILEILLFTIAGLALLHYIISYDRVIWLLKRK